MHKKIVCYEVGWFSLFTVGETYCNPNFYYDDKLYVHSKILGTLRDGFECPWRSYYDS